MKRPDNLEQVKNRIQNTEDGSVFIPSDFFDIAEAVKINVCLDRLEETGELQRVMRGIYVKPRYSTLLNKNIPPRSDDIAKAIARNYATWIYISDGPYKIYEVDGITLKFKHTDNKNEITNISYKTALVVQALKALGKSNVTDKEIRSIAKLLTENEKAQMLAEAKRVTAWVYDLIRKICKEDV